MPLPTHPRREQVADMPQEVRNAVGTRLLKLTLKELFHWRYMQTGGCGGSGVRVARLR